ncbi:MAG: Hsp20/alpha crystallin family protein [Rubrivivax sp.]|nr:Hsp20/alpha crystallin family protein [Rubrivivax sp.]
MKTKPLRHELADRMSAAWDSVAASVAEGWDWLRRSAIAALTRFQPHAGSRLPASEDIDDAGFMPGQGWAMLGGDVFEDERRVLVRLEAPGLRKGDFDIQVAGDILVVRGEKRFERERVEGRWRMLQCAYGAFERRVRLPAAVRGDEAQARYRNGVLKIELPKQTPRRPRRVEVDVA